MKKKKQKEEIIQPFNSPLIDGYLTIVGIDPGTTTLGYAKLKVSLDTLKVEEVITSTLIAKKLPTYNKDMAKVAPEVTARVFALKKYILKKFKEDQPDIVASESPFFNVRRPTSFGPLVEIFSGIRESLWEYHQGKSLFTVAPKKAKISVLADSNATKEEMKEKVGLLGLPIKDIETISEHEIDAIAVAYTLYLSNVKDLSRIKEA